MSGVKTQSQKLRELNNFHTLIIIMASTRGGVERGKSRFMLLIIFSCLVVAAYYYLTQPAEQNLDSGVAAKFYSNPSAATPKPTETTVKAGEVNADALKEMTTTTVQTVIVGRRPTVTTTTAPATGGDSGGSDVSPAEAAGGDVQAGDMNSPSASGGVAESGASQNDTIRVILVDVRQVE